MKRNKIKVWSFLLALCCLFSCDDVLEEDITDDQLTIISPTEGVTISSNVVSFQWNSLSGADEYRVQVSNANSTIVIDSLVSTNHLNHELTPGAYSWRVKGKNFAYQTAYTFPVNFTLEASNDMTNQTVVLTSPSDGTYFNDPASVILAWNAIPAADSYTFELERNPGNLIIANEPGITTTLYNVNASDLTTDAEYIWKIKALNSTTVTETAYSSRKFYLDTQDPNTPVQSNPADNANISVDTEVSFVWDNGTDTGNVMSPVTSTLQIASDVSFTTGVVTYELGASTLSQAHTFTSTGEYFWRVRNKDLAGNESGFSDTRKVIIVN